jgi:hypothetical protein
MAMGTSVFRIRIELIFCRCWNLITPWGGQHSAAENQRRLPCDGSDRPSLRGPPTKPAPAAFLEILSHKIAGPQGVR